MRIHFAKEGKKVTLCGARVLDISAQNAPRVTRNRKNFDQILDQNCCIKCKKLLPRVDLEQRRKERRQHQEALWEELLRRMDKAVALVINEKSEQPGKLLEEVNDEGNKESGEGSLSTVEVEGDRTGIGSNQTHTS